MSHEFPTTMQRTAKFDDVAMNFLYAIRCRCALRCVRSGAKHTSPIKPDVQFGEPEISYRTLWAGIATKRESSGMLKICIACNDGTYTTDFALHDLDPVMGAISEGDMLKPSHGGQGSLSALDELYVGTLRDYSHKNGYKFLGVGLDTETVRMRPRLPARLWAELDIVPIVFDRGDFNDVDEIADSMARKCTMSYGPNFQPRLMVGRLNEVEVDMAKKVSLVTREQYAQSVGQATVQAAAKYARTTRQNGLKLAFFSATPQGGGVALMRHALLRYMHLESVECSWWVPTPKPEVFQITKRNHNILQGTSEPGARFESAHRHIIEAWLQANAKRNWTVTGGPLAARSHGGADVIIVDDPQMPPLISLAKDVDPTRPVIFRSHIQIRSDLVQEQGSAAAAVWKWMWSHVYRADVYISHPVAAFVPEDVPRERVAYMPATTDWLDGLNKDLAIADIRYYLTEFNEQCRRERMPILSYPQRDYIIQIARFDPSKGLSEVLAAYAEFRRHSHYCSQLAKDKTPQLVMCGHSSVDDPDGASVFDTTLNSLEAQYAEFKDSVIILRLGPSDQMLNALLSTAHVALQLSSSEGFEVKVSEALHKGLPVIVSGAGGIPLQVQHGNGFVVDSSDRASMVRAVAGHLDELFSNKDLYNRMSSCAKKNVSDEVSTVGNAVCWMYLANQLVLNPSFAYNGRWVWELARDQIGEWIRRDEPRLQHSGRC